MKKSLVSFFFLILFSFEVSAHSWYPWQCCHDIDCGPVLELKYLDDGKMSVMTKVGIAVVGENFVRQESQDEQMHACMRKSPADGQMILMCLFVPPGN